MSTSIESFLTRELDLRFIDARTIATEARVSLGILGYPSSDQIAQVREEAIRIFHSKSGGDQRALRQLNMELVEALKNTSGECSTVSASDLDSLASENGFGVRRIRKLSSFFGG